MTMLIPSIENKLIKYYQSGLLRERKILDKGENSTITINGYSCVDFSSNDYLCLNKHSDITEHFSKSVKQYGFGSGGSVFISGYSDLHLDVETQFAKWLKVDKAILFSSGYLANVSVLSALADRHSTIISDRLCHASLLDGIQLSRAKHYRYRHADMNHLNNLLEQHVVDMLVSESVFSMEGDIAPINELINLSQVHQTNCVIDDAYGIGILGENGGGICEVYDLSQDQFTCLILPLGKAFNAMGAIVAGRSEIIDAILQFARPYRYTTALPPAICGAIAMSLSVISAAKDKREKLRKNIDFFLHYASEKGLNLIAYDRVPNKSIFIGGARQVLLLQSYLLKKGFYVAAIRPPTVPKNTSRLRVSLNVDHTHDQIRSFIDEIATGLVVCQ